LIVIDCSYALALVMPDEARPASMHRVLQETLAAPVIWPLEIANAMRSSLRRGRLHERQVAGICADVGEFEVEVVAPVHAAPKRYFDTATMHDLTPYDAMYLELALQRRGALATRDATLAAAAERAGVAVHR
jgi:predicted nucleic acid-binding protein